MRLATKLATRLATIEVPIRTSNPLNGQWGGWQVQAAKRKTERARIGKHLLGLQLPKLLRVTLTRVSPSEMDHAGLLAALKTTQDAVAHRLGLDDRPSGCVEWAFLQERGKRGEPVVRIEIERLTDG